jgi:hypothetical protein
VGTGGQGLLCNSNILQQHSVETSGQGLWCKSNILQQHSVGTSGQRLLCNSNILQQHSVGTSGQGLLCNSNILQQQYSVGTSGQGLFFYTTFSVTGHRSSVNRLQEHPVQCQRVKKLAVHCHSDVCSVAGGHSAGCRAACWGPKRAGQIIALDRVQKKAAKFASNTNDSNLEMLAQRRKLACTRAV